MYVCIVSPQKGYENKSHKNVRIYSTQRTCSTANEENLLLLSLIKREKKRKILIEKNMLCFVTFPNKNSVIFFDYC